MKDDGFHRANTYFKNRIGDSLIAGNNEEVRQARLANLGSKKLEADNEA